MRKPYALEKLSELYGEMRKNVQEHQLNDLAQKLFETSQYLYELQIEKLAAYAKSLAENVLKLPKDFHSEKFICVFEDFFGKLELLTADNQVNAAVIGRLMNTLRMGYYPTDLAHVALMRQALAFPSTLTANILDPCCGCGLALQELAKDCHALTYGAELDDSRADLAQQRLNQVARGNYFFSHIEKNAFHILFLNPPYMPVRSIYGSVRMEKRFLSASYMNLMMDGILFYIIPYYRLDEDICCFLSTHFSKLQVFRFLDSEFSKFRQILIVGRRKPYAEDKSAMKFLHAAAIYPETIPLITQLAADSYCVPQRPSQVKLFQGAQFNLYELEQQLAHTDSFLEKQSTLTLGKKRPLLPLTIGQIGLLGGSGLINGLLDCATPHVIKGQVIKTSKTSITKQHNKFGGVIEIKKTETIGNKMVFNLLTPDGFVALT